jgi:DNA-binding IscR family transcriptional regulator
LANQVCDQAKGTQTEEAVNEEATLRSPQSRKAPGGDTERRESALGLELALKTLVRMLSYLGQPSSHTCGGFVSVSSLADDTKQPLNLVSQIALRLGRTGYLHTRGTRPDEVRLSGSVREAHLADLVLAAHSPEKPTEQIRESLGELGRVQVKDILPAPATKTDAPIHLKAAAASVLGIIFCMAVFGLSKVPTALASLGLALLLVSYTLHWLGRRSNLDVLPQCVLEAVMAGSLLWVAFGLVDLYW